MRALDVRLMEIGEFSSSVPVTCLTMGIQTKARPMVLCDNLSVFFLYLIILFYMSG